MCGEGLVLERSEGEMDGGGKEATTVEMRRVDIIRRDGEQVDRNIHQPKRSYCTRRGERGM